MYRYIINQLIEWEKTEDRKPLIVLGGCTVRVSISQKAKNDIITVHGAAGERIRLFDSVGRMLANEMNSAEVKSFQVPSSGAYLVQVGNRPARKVVVIR